MTPSPGLKRGVLDASTTPAASMPPTHGKRRMILPLPVAASASLKLMLAYCTRTVTPPGSRSASVKVVKAALTPLGVLEIRYAGKESCGWLIACSVECAGLHCGAAGGGHPGPRIKSGAGPIRDPCRARNEISRAGIELSHPTARSALMPTTQHDKAAAFRALHEAPGAFLIANAWDAGSARILAALGFPALATSSGASAGVLGRRDGKVTRDEALAHCRAIVAATDLPVSADLEKGFGDAPEVVAETIRLAAQAGLVGGSIEDSTGNPQQPFYGMTQAAERVAAAVQAARSLPFPFTLTARAEN